MTLKTYFKVTCCKNNTSIIASTSYLGGVASVVHFITGHDMNRLNQPESVIFLSFRVFPFLPKNLAFQRTNLCSCLCCLSCYRYVTFECSVELEKEG